MEGRRDERAYHEDYSRRSELELQAQREKATHIESHLVERAYVATHQPHEQKYSSS